MAPVTWMIMGRDISHAVRITGEPVVVAAMILDVDTGLVRGMSVADEIRAAIAQAMEVALHKPAGSLPPGRPRRILAAVGMGENVVDALSHQKGLGLVPQIEEIEPGTEAEDIFDSIVGHISGRRQPSNPPSPSAWNDLYHHVQAYVDAAPWDRWADDIDFRIEAVIDESPIRMNAVILGKSGISTGLALFPGDVVELDVDDLGDSTTGPYEAGTIVCTLDDPDDVPPEFTARANRYGWSRESSLVPLFFTFDGEGGREISETDADLFAVFTAAVVAHDERHRSPKVLSGTATEGKVQLSNSGSVSFSVRHRPRKSR